MTGTVKWFDAKKGYGFIQTDEGTDVFVHQSNIRMKGFRFLEEGDMVEYSTEINEKGTYAVDVIPVLTADMMRKKALEDQKYLEETRDIYGSRKWMIVDQNNIIQKPTEQGMTLEELNEYFS